MMKSIQQVSTEELRSYVEFSKGLVTKSSELADLAEVEAIVQSGNGYVAVDRKPRQWEHVIAYIIPGTLDIVPRVVAHWVHRPASATITSIAIDVSNVIWEQQPSTNNWVNISTGEHRMFTDPSWRLLNTPSGELYIDTIKAKVYVPVMIWYDQSTGDYSTIGPGSNEFIGNSNNNEGVYPLGLSATISTPQEYVTAKIRLTAGGLTGGERTTLEAAIENFEAPGLWEDVRQPIFAIDPNNGAPILDSDGIPQLNPMRVSQVAFRGELNDYYRRLVRDYNVDPFLARTAEQFEIITWNSGFGRLSSLSQRRYVAMHSECVRIYKTAFYNVVFEGDALYFNYCRMFIAWMAVMRMVNDKMGSILDIDRMDSYDLTNMLYSFGIYQFDDMPLAYKRRFAKSLERMLANKGTTAVFKDVLAIFGLDKDVKIWKHYLVKYFPSNNLVLRLDREPTSDEVIVAYLEGGQEITSPSLESLGRELINTGAYRDVKLNGLIMSVIRTYDTATIEVSSLAIVRTSDRAVVEYGFSEVGGTDYSAPEVGFHKVDINDPDAESTIAGMDSSEIAEYDEFVRRDVTWETSRQDARDMAFSTLQTKYFSISSAVDTVYNGMSMGIMWAMLKDAEARGRAGGLVITSTSSIPGVASMNLFEGLVAALILMLWQFKVDDIIPHGESGVSVITAARTDGVPFPNEGSLLPFSTHIERVADKPDPLQAQDIADMTDINVGIAQKLDTSLNDNARYSDGIPFDPLRGGEEGQAFDKDAELRRMWNHKFVSTYQTIAFGAADRYSDWLRSVNPTLMEWVESMDSADDHTDGLLTLTSLIESSIETKTLNLPAILGVDDILLTYVERLIRFFKAYTTDLRQISTYMLIDRPATESLRLINLLAGINVDLDFDERFELLRDFARAISKFSFKEAKDGGMFNELIEVLGKLKEQEIVKFLEYLPAWAVWRLRVEPAAVMHDTASIRSMNGHGDVLTMATRYQRNGDIVTAQAVDKIPTLAEYAECRPWRATPRHGLADGAIILKPESE